MKKKWGKLEDRTTEIAKCEVLFENGLKENGFNILGFRWYLEKTEYLIEKDGITLMAIHYRGKANKKIIEAQIKWVTDCFELKKKIN